MNNYIDLENMEVPMSQRENKLFSKTLKCVQIANVHRASRLIEDLVDGTMLLADITSGQERVQANRMHEKALELMAEMNVAERIH